MNETLTRKPEHVITPEVLDELFMCIQDMLRDPEMRGSILAGAGVEKSIKTKEDQSGVTQMDLKVERKVREELQRQFPDVPVFGEEGGYDLAELEKLDSFWLLDPIDGTSAYIKGESTFTSMAMCIERNQAGELEVTRAMIYNPSENVMFSAKKGQGTHKTTFDDNGVPIEEVQIDLGRPLPEGAPKVAMCKDKLIPQVSHMFESEDLDCQPAPSGGGFRYTQVLDGTIVAGFQLHGGGQVHDYAAGLLLVEEAGGVVVPILADKISWNNGVSSVACRADLEPAVKRCIPQLRELERAKPVKRKS